MPEETFTSQGIVEDTRRGLQSDPKWLSSLYFYDEHGSHLFEAICDTPEYYLTRCEQAILDVHGSDILRAAGPPLAIGELGSGSSRKTRTLLEQALQEQGPTDYMPVDVSAEFLHGVASSLQADMAGLHVHPIAAEYGKGLSSIGRFEAPRRLVLFLGSSIGNFEPEEQEALLRHARQCLQPGDAFLLGTDLVKQPHDLEAAYDDAEGVTAAFNKNILAHLNARLDGNADPEAFHHEARWDPERKRIVMRLVSLHDQVVSFKAAGLEVRLDKGEPIHTENAYKFDAAALDRLWHASGFVHENSWTDADGRFALHLLRVP